MLNWLFPDMKGNGGGLVLNSWIVSRPPYKTSGFLSFVVMPDSIRHPVHSKGAF